MKPKFEWKEINERSTGITYRVEVIGGWLVRNNDWDDTFGQCESMVFISDPNHEWEIE